MGIVNWIVSCYRRVKASTHKRFIVLFVSLVIMVPWVAVSVLEQFIGFQTPQWAWNSWMVILLTLGLGWLDIFRELPHHDRSDGNLS